MLTLEQAQAIARASHASARAQNLQPVTVVVLDARAAIVSASAEDGSGLGRFAIARGKANGALALGLGSRSIAARAKAHPALITCFSEVIEGGLVAAAGGVLIRNGAGEIIGAVGISGDQSDRDEAAAVDGIQSAGFIADAGTDG